jgi:glycosyltransferase involved in cell wall biosynthesis
VPAEETVELGDVVLAHDYLNQRGGAERVVLELMRMFPHAPLYTSLYRAGSTWPEFRGRDIHTSPLQHLPVDRRFRALFPLYPLAFRALGELDGDVVLSSSSGWAHAVRTSPRSLHVVYCYTPARWLYTSGYLGESRTSRLLAPALALARRWDHSAAKRADRYVAISAFVAERIKRVYGLDAPVVHPPVDVSRFRASPRGERLLVVSRLLAYKRVDAIIAAATRAGIGLDVVGTGPALSSLRRLAGPSVVFHGAASDDVVTALMQSCRALCLPGMEDFGITPVEAQAAGKPVVAYAGGGALETVEEGVTGSFFASHDTAAVIDAIERCDAITVAPESIAEHARRFSPERFRSQLTSLIRRFQVERGA